MSTKKWMCWIVAICWTAATPAAVMATEPGVTPQSVTIGMSAPLSGPNAVYGNGLLQGVQLGLNRLNESGGIDGRRVSLQVLDDGGSIERVQANTRVLLNNGVFALTGYHGARAVESILPLLDQTRTPMIGAASSAESLREPPRRGLFNLRAGAAEEAAAIVYQLDTIGMTRLAAIGQEDGLGRAGLDAIQIELVRLAIRPVAVARISGQDPSELVRQAPTICAAQPDVVLLALEARAALDAIRALRTAGCGAQFYVMSETGADLPSQVGVQANELQGVVVSQVLPSPDRLAHPLVAEFRRDLARLPNVRASYPVLEGYLYARVLGEALRVCARVLSRDCLVDVLESGRVELPGYKLNFDAANRRGSKFVELTLMDGRGGLRR